MHASVPISHSNTDFEGFQSGILAALIHFYLKFGSWANVQQYSSLLKFAHLEVHPAGIL